LAVQRPASRSAVSRTTSRNGSKADGLPVEQAAWRLGMSIREYRELEAGTRSPTFVTWDRICKPYGWAADVLSSERPVPSSLRSAILGS
jgi:hypothetical protein